MFVRKLALCVVLFCLVSLFVGVPFAKAHLDAIFEAKRQSDNADDERDKWEKRYNGAKAAVDTLLAAWTSNEASIKDNTWDVANTVAATVISLILEEVLTDDPGDGGAMKNEWFKELVERLPALLTAINAAKETVDLYGDLSVRESYLLALNTAVAALDKIISDNQAAFDAYEKKYDAYVKKMQDHMTLK